MSNASTAGTPASSNTPVNDSPDIFHRLENALRRSTTETHTSEASIRIGQLEEENAFLRRQLYALDDRLADEQFYCRHLEGTIERLQQYYEDVSETLLNRRLVTISQRMRSLEYEIARARDVIDRVKTALTEPNVVSAEEIIMLLNLE